MDRITPAPARPLFAIARESVLGVVYWDWDDRWAENWRRSWGNKSAAQRLLNRLQQGGRHADNATVVRVQ